MKTEPEARKKPEPQPGHINRHALKLGSRWNFIVAVGLLLLEINKIIQRTN